jgi:hypothetical protein
MANEWRAVKKNFSSYFRLRFSLSLSLSIRTMRQCRCENIFSLCCHNSIFIIIVESEIYERSRKNSKLFPFERSMVMVVVNPLNECERERGDRKEGMMR